MSILECQDPAQKQTSLLKTFWRRFCSHINQQEYKNKL